MPSDNPFDVVLHGENNPDDNPFAGVVATRTPQSVLPEQVDPLKEKYGPFAPFFAQAPARTKTLPTTIRPAAATAAPVGTTPGGGGDPLVQTLYRAGFRGEALKTAWAIAKRESGGRAEAFNPRRSTGDLSYGLFQINMLDKLGPDRRARYGLKSNEDLLNADTNARVAFAMSKGGTDFGPWGIGPNAYRKMPPLDYSGYPGLAPVAQVVPGNDIGSRAVRQAATQLGKPYQFASSPGSASFDCSELVQWSYAQLGIKVPRDTYGQQRALPLKSWANLKPGDPIYRKSGGHVVIYAGNGQVIAAPHTGTVVQYQPLSNFPQSDWEVRSATG